MKRIKLVWLLGLLLLLALPSGVALAESGNNPFDRIVTGGEYLLKSGETERGEVVVMGGSAEIQEGAILDGELMVVGGDVEIYGTVTGNVAAIGGDVDIMSTAHVEGDCVLLGGNVDIDDGARVDGEVVTNPDSRWTPFLGSERDGSRELVPLPELPTPPEPSIPYVPTPSRVVYRHGPSLASQVGGAFLTALMVGVLALLAALFWPKQVDQVRRTAARQAATSGLVGFVTLLAAGLLTPVLVLVSAVLILVCIGLLGFPLIALLWLLIAVAGLFGWAAIGMEIGRWINKRLAIQGMTPMLEAALGAATLSFALGLIMAIPVLGIAGGLVQFGIGCIGLGAVLLTRFGTRDYQSGQPILPQRKPKPPVSPVAPEPAADEVALPAVEEPALKEAPAPPAPPAPSEPVAPDDEMVENSRFEAPPLDEEGPFPEL